MREESRFSDKCINTMHVCNCAQIIYSGTGYLPNAFKLLFVPYFFFWTKM